MSATSQRCLTPSLPGQQQEPSGLTLDGLHHERSSPAVLLLEAGLQSVHIIVGHRAEPRSERAEAPTAVRVGGGGAGGNGTAPEVLPGEDDLGLVGRDTCEWRTRKIPLKYGCKICVRIREPLPGVQPTRWKKGVWRAA